MDEQNGSNQIGGESGGMCKCSGLEKNDETLEIKLPEVYDGDLTAIVQLKSYSRKFISMDFTLPFLHSKDCQKFK